METLYLRCHGLDVHKASATACVRLQGGRGKLEKYVRRFNTMIDLRGLAAWLIELGGNAFSDGEWPSRHIPPHFTEQRQDHGHESGNLRQIHSE